MKTKDLTEVEVKQSKEVLATAIITFDVPVSVQMLVEVDKDGLIMRNELGTIKHVLQQKARDQISRGEYSSKLKITHIGEPS